MGIIPQLALNGIIAGSIYLLVAVGFNLIYGATKFFNLAHGAMAAIGGYVVFLLIQPARISIFGLYTFTTSGGVSTILSITAGVLTAGLIGYALDKFIYLPLRKKGASHMILLVASLGAFTALQATIAILFSSQFQTLSQNIGAPKIYNILGGVMTQTQIIILASGLIISFGLLLLLKKTLFGKAVKAISDDEEVSRIAGINTNKIIGHVFFIGSAIAGLAGILVGYDTGIEPVMGMSLLLKGVIAAIIGGIGSIYGAIVGSFLLGFIENFGIWKISGEWKDAIAFGLLIIFLLFRPRGIIKK